MQHVFTIYILIGALIVLPSVDNLTFMQIIVILLTWPIVLYISVLNILKGGY